MRDMKAWMEEQLPTDPVKFTEKWRDKLVELFPDLNFPTDPVEFRRVMYPRLLQKLDKEVAAEQKKRRK